MLGLEVLRPRYFFRSYIHVVGERFSSHRGSLDSASSVDNRVVVSTFVTIVL